MPEISFFETGHGPAIVLLHGFPMNSLVWREFTPLLSDSFKIITPDLPGFGHSTLLMKPFSMDDVAGEINGWLTEKNIAPAVIIGHSLGGYVTLAMMEKNPEIFAAAGLLHSTAYADGEEKKISRTKVIEFVEKNGALAFTSNFIQGLFVNPESPAIETVTRIAIQSSQETVTGYTAAMRDRPDRKETIQKFKKPILLMAGEKDGGIPPETLQHQASLTNQAQIHILEGVAHMGMYEDPLRVAHLIRQFANHCYDQQLAKF